MRRWLAFFALWLIPGLACGELWDHVLPPSWFAGIVIGVIWWAIALVVVDP